VSAGIGKSKPIVLRPHDGLFSLLCLSFSRCATCGQYSDDKDAGARGASDVFPTFHANTPDGKRLSQETRVPMCMIGGKCACFRAKTVEISGHLLSGHPYLCHQERDWAHSSLCEGGYNRLSLHQHIGCPLKSCQCISHPEMYPLYNPISLWYRFFCSILPGLIPATKVSRSAFSQCVLFTGSLLDVVTNWSVLLSAHRCASPYEPGAGIIHWITLARERIFYGLS
jgi:hypothetical protein